MVKRCIGIDIGSSYLCAVQLSRTGEQFHIEKVFSIQTRRTSDSPPDILRSLTSKYGFDRHADVAMSMPHNTVFFRNLETDFAGSEQIREHSLSALGHNFPLQPDEIIAQACSYHQLPGEKYSVLMAAVTRTSLRERLNIAATAKMHTNLVEAAIFAIHSTIAVNHPKIMTGRAIIAYIDEPYLTLAVTENDSILIVRNIPIISCSDDNSTVTQEQVVEALLQEAEITWRKLFGAEIEQDTKIYLVAGDGIAIGLAPAVEENLHCQTTTVDPYAKVQCFAEHNGDVGICVAEGLALRLLAPEKTTGINFLEADNCSIKPTLDLKKEFVICAMLVAAIAVVSLGGLFMRLSLLENKYAKVKNEIRRIFQRTFPEETNIVSPVAQLDQKLEAVRKDYRLFASFGPTNLSPLEVLRRITVNTPQQENAKIDNLFVTAESVRLNGSCRSFKSVYQWQRLLREVPEFTIVDVQDAQREPESGAVHFTMLISSAGSVAISEHK